MLTTAGDRDGALHGAPAELRIAHVDADSAARAAQAHDRAAAGFGPPSRRALARAPGSAASHAHDGATRPRALARFDEESSR